MCNVTKYEKDLWRCGICHFVESDIDPILAANAMLHHNLIATCVANDVKSRWTGASAVERRDNLYDSAQWNYALFLDVMRYDLGQEAWFRRAINIFKQKQCPLRECRMVVVSSGRKECFNCRNKEVEEWPSQRTCSSEAGWELIVED